MATSFLSEWLDRVKAKAAKKVPMFLNTRRLTFLTLLFAIMVFVSYSLAYKHLGFIWLASFFIFAHLISDNLDGAVGRYRREGYVKWGLYADHFFDFIHFTALVFGLYMVIREPAFLTYFIIIYILGCAFFIHCFLYASATGRFIVSALMISALEIILGLLVFNTIIFFFGKKILLNHILYIVLIIIMFLTLIFSFIKVQRKLAEIDMKIKNRNKKNNKKKT